MRLCASRCKERPQYIELNVWLEKGREKEEGGKRGGEGGRGREREGGEGEKERGYREIILLS